jgi:hypothetical protein
MGWSNTSRGWTPPSGSCPVEMLAVLVVGRPVILD